VALPSRERLVAAVAVLSTDSRNALFLSLAQRVPDDEVARRLRLNIRTVRRDRARAIACVANELDLTRPQDVAELLRALLMLPARDWPVPPLSASATGGSLEPEPDALLKGGRVGLPERVALAVAGLDLETRALLHAWVRGISDERLAILLRKDTANRHARRVEAIERIIVELRIDGGQELADTLLALYGLSEREWGLPSPEAVRLGEEADLESPLADPAVGGRPSAARLRPQLGRRGWPRRPRWVAVATLPVGLVVVVAALGAGAGVVVGPFGGKNRGGTSADHPPALSSRAPERGGEVVATAQTPTRRGNRVSTDEGRLSKVYALARAPSAHSLAQHGGISRSPGGASGESPSDGGRSRPHGPDPDGNEPKTPPPNKPQSPTPNGSPPSTVAPTETVAQAPVPIAVTSASEPGEVPASSSAEDASGTTTSSPEPNGQAARPGLGCGDANHVHLREADCGFPAR
jgi:hypothetical protein